MSNYNNNESKTKKKLGRPSKGRTPSEQREYLKLRSRIYYADPKNKEAQRIKVHQHVLQNKKTVYERNNKRRRMQTFERRLKKIWISRGLIIGI
jgi:hypothetical protein